MITKLLRPSKERGAQNSAKAARIKELLGVPLPADRIAMRSQVSEQRQKLASILDKMTEEQLRKAADFLESLVSKT